MSHNDTVQQPVNLKRHLTLSGGYRPVVSLAHAVSGMVSWLCGLIIVSFLFPGLLSGQDYALEIQQLQAALTKSNTPEQRTDLLNDISFAYRRTNVDSMLLYANQALALSEQIGYKQGQAIAWKNIGTGYSKHSRPLTDIIDAYTQALTIAKEIDDKLTQVACYNNLGAAYDGNNKLNLSLSSSLLGIHLCEQESLTDHPLYFLLLCNTGSAYLKLGRLEEAEDYLGRGLFLAKAQNNNRVYSIFVEDWAALLVEKQDTSAAIDYINSSMELHLSINDYQSATLNGLRAANLLFQQNKLEAAKAKILSTIEFARHRQYRLAKTRSYLLAAKIYHQFGQLDTTILFSNEALTRAIDMDNLDLQAQANQQLADAYAARKQFELAYQHQHTSTLIAKKTLEQEIAHGLQSIEDKTQLLSTQEALDLSTQAAERQTTLSSILGILLFLTLLAAILAVYFGLRSNTAQHELAKKNEQLEYYINENLQLENFTYVASHDLKTPLRNITSFAQILDLRLKDRLKADESAYFKIISRYAKELSQLIDDLQAFATSHLQELQLKRLSVGEVIQNVIENLYIYIEEANAGIHLLGENDYFLGDQLKIQQVIQNLVANGLKFVPDDRQPEILITMTSQPDDWYFTVKDNGIGIKQEQLDNIFIAFKRLNNKDDYGGSGLGLAICKRIIEAHGGKIWATSEPGIGTTFHFTISKPASEKRNAANTPQVITN